MTVSTSTGGALVRRLASLVVIFVATGAVTMAVLYTQRGLDGRATANESRPDWVTEDGQIDLDRAPESFPIFDENGDVMIDCDGNQVEVTLEEILAGPGSDADPDSIVAADATSTGIDGTQSAIEVDIYVPRLDGRNVNCD